MSNKHHSKRKKQKGAPQADSATIATTINQETPTTKEGQDTRNDNAYSKEPLMSTFVTLLRNDPKFLLEVGAVFFGAAVAIIYFFQLRVMQNQLKLTTQALQIDQRAWVGPSGVSVDLKPDQPLTYSALLINSGKTPAVHVETNGAGRIMPTDQPFSAVYPDPTGQKTSAILQPNQTIRIPGTSGYVLTKANIDRIQSGIDTAYIYGKASYQDIFGKTHRVTFCYYISGNVAHVYNCSQYNEAD